ncbi:hypothetical protein L3V83_08135 [Thiotrichales bacterium 19X7-9]|nr:hypothetical protein [Thiotrichales bacterium 19X7-9]
MPMTTYEIQYWNQQVISNSTILLGRSLSDDQTKQLQEEYNKLISAYNTKERDYHGSSHAEDMASEKYSFFKTHEGENHPLKHELATQKDQFFENDAQRSRYDALRELSALWHDKYQLHFDSVKLDQKVAKYVEKVDSKYQLKDASTDDPSKPVVDLCLQMFGFKAGDELPAPNSGLNEYTSALDAALVFHNQGMKLKDIAVMVMAIANTIPFRSGSLEKHTDRLIEFNEHLKTSGQECLTDLEIQQARLLTLDMSTQDVSNFAGNLKETESQRLQVFVKGSEKIIPENRNTPTFINGLKSMRRFYNNHLNDRKVFDYNNIYEQARLTSPTGQLIKVPNDETFDTKKEYTQQNLRNGIVLYDARIAFHTDPRPSNQEAIDTIFKGYTNLEIDEIKSGIIAVTETLQQIDPTVVNYFNQLADSYIAKRISQNQASSLTQPATPLQPFQLLENTSNEQTGPSPQM